MKKYVIEESRDEAGLRVWRWVMYHNGKRQASGPDEDRKELAEAGLGRFVVLLTK